MERPLHFTASGFKSRIVDLAPAAASDNPDSKRYALIADSDSQLDSNLQILETGTRARNKALQERLDEVWASTRGYDAKLRVEAKEATETILNLREEYQRQIDAFSTQLQMEIKAAFDRIDDDLYPVQTSRVVEITKSLDFFVQETVPAAIEQQSGVVSRRLKTAYEAFDIEKQKEAKREAKFVNKANLLIQTTAQRFGDETALMTSNLHQLHDDVVETERRGARMTLIRHAAAVSNVKEVRDIIAKETSIRTSEDMELLDCVIDTQTLLQKTVLEHFGADAEADAGAGGGGAVGGKGKKGRFNKLAARMDKRAQHQAAAAAASTSEGGEDAGISEGKGDDAEGASGEPVVQA